MNFKRRSKERKKERKDLLFCENLFFSFQFERIIEKHFFFSAKKRRDICGQFELSFDPRGLLIKFLESLSWWTFISGPITEIPCQIEARVALSLGFVGSREKIANNTSSISGIVEYFSSNIFFLSFNLSLSFSYLFLTYHSHERIVKIHSFEKAHKRTWLDRLDTVSLPSLCFQVSLLETTRRWRRRR